MQDYDDVVSFLANVQDSYGYGEELVSEPSLDNYFKYQEERSKQALELQRFKRRHAPELLA